MAITITATAKAPLGTVWNAWTTPADIMKWNAASDDWHTPHAEVDLRVGGQFLSRMEAKDGSFGFDFSGTYTEVIPHKRIAFAMEDGRTVSIAFEPVDGGVRIVETFDPETEHSLDMQEQGWQAILDNFVRHVEAE